MQNILEDDASGDQSISYQTLAVATEGWLLLLPESKKSATLEVGEVDELMFQAFMVIHA